MGRRDPDPRPPIEIVGAAPAAESVQVVSTGPRRPRRSTVRTLAIGVGVALLLVGGLALGDGGGGAAPAGRGEEAERDDSERLPLKERTTTTRPRTTTTRPPTTTTTIPVGPVFGQPVGASLLVYGPRGWQLLDLDTGARVRLEGLPSSDAYDARPVAGGVVLPARDGSREARYYPVTRDGAVGEPVALGAADQILSTRRADRVWLVDAGGPAFEGYGRMASLTAQVRLVDLDGDVLRSFEVDTSYVTHVVEAGLVVERGGRVYLADEGGITPVTVGFTLGVIGDDLLVVACDDAGACGVERQPVGGGAAQRLLSTGGLEEFGFESVTAPDGRVALLRYEGEGGQTVFLFSADGTLVGNLRELASSFVGLPRWLPGDAGLVVPVGDAVRWIRPEGATWVAETPPGLVGLPAETIIVIEW